MFAKMRFVINSPFMLPTGSLFPLLQGFAFRAENVLWPASLISCTLCFPASCWERLRLRSEMCPSRFKLCKVWFSENGRQVVRQCDDASSCRRSSRCCVCCLDSSFRLRHNLSPLSIWRGCTTKAVTWLVSDRICPILDKAAMVKIK